MGDLVGFAALSAVLVVSRRRLRHEAAVSLGSIFGVLVVNPRWPLRFGSRSWWVAVAVGLCGYLMARRGLLGDHTGR